MPSVSSAQQAAAAMALSAKRRAIPASKLTGAAKRMYDSMSASQLEEFASTSTEGLPKHKPKKGSWAKEMK